MLKNTKLFIFKTLVFLLPVFACVIYFFLSEAGDEMDSFVSFIFASPFLIIVFAFHFSWYAQVLVKFVIDHFQLRKEQV